MKGDRFAGGPADALKRAKHPPTRFVAYTEDPTRGYEGKIEGRLLAAFREESPVEEVRAGEEADFVFDRTTFYAEGGGQVGDHGRARTFSKTAELVGEAEITDVQSRDGYAFHRATVKHGVLRRGDAVALEVDPDWRWRVAKNHTATHLLHQALKDVLGPTVNQAGSLVHPDYLRFDFTWSKKLSDEEIRAVEDLVNRKVMEAIPVTWAVKSIEEAQAEGACMLFGEKYGERVRVLAVPGFSKELCGGTHVVNTGNIGAFRITKETALGSGVRRLFAVTGPGALEEARRIEAVLAGAAERLRVPPDRVPERIESLLREWKEARSRKPAAAGPSAKESLDALLGRAEAIGPFRFASSLLAGTPVADLRSAATKALSRLGPAGVVALFGGGDGGGVPFVVAAGEDALRAGFSAGEAAREVGRVLGGGGGGKPSLGQGEGKEVAAVEAARDAVRAQLRAAGAVDSRKGHS